MPSIRFFGAPVRVRAMLDAIGAQEALEAWGQRVLPPVYGAARLRAHERERMALAGRRNRAERKLRPAEHAAWVAWRASDEVVRAAAYAILTDLPR